MLHAVTGTGWRIGRIGGVELRLDPTWAFVAFGLMVATWNSLHRLDPHAHKTVPYAIGAAAIVITMYAGSIVLHELAHMVLRRAFNMGVERVTFWGLGSVAILAGDPRSASSEAIVAAGGAIANGVAGAALVLFARGLPTGHVHHALAVWGLVNLLIAYANVVPGYLLDADDLIGAVAWKLTGDRARARRIATRVGQVFGVLVAAAGFLPILHLGFALAIMVAVSALSAVSAATTALRRAKAPDAEPVAEDSGSPPDGP